MKRLLLILLTLPMLCFSQKKQKNGPYETYYQNGKTKTIGNYSENKKTGLWKSFYDNGVLKTESLHDKATNLVVTKNVYYRNGKIKTKIKKQPNGKFIEKSYFKNNGNLQYEVNYIIETKDNKQIVGSYKDYYSDKKLKTESTYVKGELHGKWKQFYNTGTLNWVVNYKNGYKVGPYKKFHKNGSIQIKGHCENNLKNGKEQTLDANGNVIWEGSFLNNKHHSTWVHTNNKNQKKTYKYINGKLKKGNKDLKHKQVNIPVGAFKSYPMYTGCDNTVSMSNQRKCTKNKISQFIKNNINTYLIKKLNLKSNERLKLLLLVDKQGNITPSKIKTQNAKIKAEVLDVINKLPQITPGEKIQQPASMYIALSILLN